MLWSWAPQDPDQQRLRDDSLRLLAEGGARVVDRDLGRVHVTGSAFVFTPDLGEVLLCLHRKAGLWLQLGGHVEPTDRSLLHTAFREAREESGITDLHADGEVPLDLDRHDLAAGFVRCDTHWDVGYGFLATGRPVVSDESEAVRWWPVDGLPASSPPGLALPVRRAALAARASISPR